ncbi:MAG: 50S ribosomal protein L9 [Desulfuromonadales bacterium C00003068]|jgi:large subunit ribosomal protein L9|nr:MAG: 50S ribosomal protein L9 [Desulfuromonadales bacterium C00003068]
MEIILTESVNGLGEIGEMVNVKPGFARNYLLPQGFAVVADKNSVKQFEHQKRQLEHKALKLAKSADAMKTKIEAVACVFALRAGDDGKLFGSVTSADICAKLAEAGVEVDRKKIQLDESIKALGDHKVAVKLPAKVVAEISVSIIAAE